MTPDEEVKEGSAIRHKARKVSTLAGSLLTKNKKRMVAARSRRKKTKSGAVRGGGFATRKVSKAELEMAEARRKAAIAAALGGHVGGKRERVIRAGIGGAKQVTPGQLRKACAAKLARLKRCAESLADGAGFAAKLHVNEYGMIDRVDCRVGGKMNTLLSGCAAKAFKRVNFGRQKKQSTLTCSVGGS